MQMRLFRVCFVVACFALGGAALADVTISQSNQPAASLEDSLAALLGQERSGLDAVSPERLGMVARLPAQKPRGGAKSDAGAPRYDAQWLAGLPAAKGDREWQCLAQALYFEARGETIEGQFAVAEVILNRTITPGYPRSICGVVHQGGNGGCQFSYTCDGKSDAVSERAAYATAGKIARLMLDGAPRTLTDGATHFHTRQVSPSWSRRFELTTAIGQHVFYRQTSG